MSAPVRQHGFMAPSLEQPLFKHHYSSFLLHVLVNGWVKNTLGSRTTELTIVLQEVQADIKNNKALNRFRKKPTIKAAPKNERSLWKRIKGFASSCWQQLSSSCLPIHHGRVTRYFSRTGKSHQSHFLVFPQPCPFAVGSQTGATELLLEPQHGHAPTLH